MKLVSAALKAKEIQIKDLPENLQSEVASLKELIDKYNEAVDSYDDEDETDEDTEKELDKMEDYIVETEKALADKISSYQKVVEPTEQEKAASAAAEAAAEAAKKSAEGEPKKEDSSVGWLIFGTVVLVATVGMVNVFKKK
jgi:septal ring factor EnvC (AmiA/AmiB activator)